MSAPSRAADPIEAWRQWLTESERQWNAFLNQLMGTEEFSAGMARMMEVSLRGQKEAADLMGRWLESLNLPSRGDILALGDRLSALEARLLTLAERIPVPPSADDGAANLAPAPAQPRPPRTRRPTADSSG